MACVDNLMSRGGSFIMCALPFWSLPFLMGCLSFGVLALGGSVVSKEGFQFCRLREHNLQCQTRSWGNAWLKHCFWICLLMQFRFGEASHGTGS